MDHRGGLAVYVTSHGFGHLNRVVAVLNRIPAEIPMVVRCGADLFDHWRERLDRPARFEHQLWDVGAVNPLGASSVTDGRATIERAMANHAALLPRIDEEASRLRAEGTAVVLCDVPPMPLAAAARAGVPGFALANFTWSEIYAEHAAGMGAEARAMVHEIESFYGQATAVFRAEPALPMREFRNQIPVGLVVSKGRERRAELRARLGLGDEQKLVYFYVGRYGQEDLAWDRLAGFSGIHFVGFHEASVGPLPNLHVVPAAEWRGADLMASCDAAVAKAGYGTVTEAMAAGTPMLFPPRENFAEHAALESALLNWGGGYLVDEHRFREFDLSEPLARALATRPGPALYPTDGADRIAESLVLEIRSRVVSGGLSPA